VLWFKLNEYEKKGRVGEDEEEWEGEEEELAYL